VPSLEVFPGYHSALEVSGDFYDLVVLEGGRVLIAIADAAGKGISACLFSLSFRSMLRSVAATQQDLAAIVRIANDLLMYDTSLSSFFITAWLGLYDPKSGELSYCSQGHPPTLLVREKEVQLLSTGGIAFGVEPIDPTIKTIQLLRQDLLFLYTDGITEAENGRKELFGMERLKEVILRSRASLKADARLLLDEIEQFCAGASQSDDVTFLFLRVK
jgi:sigma-B regulation protein RsbU (phosphoserine phosphatase)